MTGKLKRDFIKRSLSIFLAFVMVFSIVLQSGITSHAEELSSNVITKAFVTDLEGNPITAPMDAWKAFRVNAEYALPNNQVKEGDTTTLTLPVGFAPYAPFNFDIKDASNNIIANGKLVDESPMKVVLTYTKYAEEHSGVKGSFYFNIQINSGTQTQTGVIPVTLTAKGDGTVIQAGTVTYNPHQVTGVQLIKGGWMDSGNKTIGHYKIAINQANKEMVNAKVTDTLLNPGVEYIENSFQILEGKWVSNATGTDILFTEQSDITAQYKDKLKVEGNKFTLDIGNRPAGKGMMIRYKVKISYEPVVGEIFKNKVELIDGDKTFSYSASYKITDASGGGEGYVYKIKVNKTGKNGIPLSGVEFDVIRVRNNQKVGTITTGADGTGEIGNLVLDKYKLVETKTPSGYLPLTEPVFVEESDFTGNDKIALKNIVNQPNEKISVSVTKKWIGPAKDSVIVELRKVGSNDVLQEYELKASDNWKHTFTGLDKYEDDGTLIKYEVVEKNVPEGYTSEVTGTMENGFTITNTNVEKVEVSVTKKWVGPAKDSIIVELKKVGSNDVLQEYELKASDNWKHTFTNLPKYEDDGTEIKYEVVEKSVGAGYISSIEGTMENGFTITNTNVEKVEVSVTKKWVGPAKDSVIVELRKVGSNDVLQEYELKASDNWKHTFTNLPKYEDDGTEIKYEVVEKSVGAGYISSIEGTMEDGFTITNTNVEKVNIPVEKRWVGDVGNSVLVELRKVGSNDVIQEHELKASENWKHTFEGLDKYEADGTEIEYEVVEKNVPAGYEVSYEKTQNGTIIIKNTKIKTEVKVTKEWVVDEDEHPTIKLQLLKNGQAEGEPVELSNGNTTYTWTNLDKADAQGNDYVYTVKEVGEVGNHIKLGDSWYKVIYGGNQQTGLTVTNKKLTPWTPIVPPTRNLKVTKEWLGTNGNQIAAPLDKIEVELYRDGKATGQKLELNKENNWTGEFKNLKVYESIEDSKTYEYTVKEVGEKNNSVKFDDKIFKVSYLGNMKDGIKVVNTESPALPPSTPSEKPKKPKLAKTGIATSTSIYSGILAISGVIMLFLKKRNQNKDTNI
ncbi:Cna B-type domain-containing protein [Parvimonas sp. G1967]|uniref:Cna B-type domain-containing protein n=1 Tax=Parvimonas sp. G1967 TaxID=3387695 RepID=UPI0039E406B6